jgi:SAM-dependent methyltransferase
LSTLATIKKLRGQIERKAWHLVFGNRNWIKGQLGDVSKLVGDGRVLEIGSGRHDFGANAFSMRELFSPGCDFVRSDFNPEFGHLVVDVTTMDFTEEYDAILCVSVLEHVPEFWLAVPRLLQALKPGGVLALSVPMIFPYHDEPADFWRLTTYGAKSLLREFSQVDVRSRGPRRLPFTVFAIATK